jgi:RHS repeat-associated protein
MISACSGPEGTHTVNSGDQLTDAGFAYDHDGGLTAGGGLSFDYNGIGQTTSIAKAGNPTAYTYAGGGQAERTVAGATTAVHGMLGLMTETTAGATTSYIRGPGGGLIAERTPVGDFYYVHDGLGSVIALVAPDGTQRAAYTYDPYGNKVTETPMHGDLPPNPWRWSGSYLDATGLYKMGARYYDPGLGRFTQTDPVTGGSANAYDYCSGDPVNCTDPSGLKGTKPLPPELAEPCLSGNETQLRLDVCERYRMALVTGDSDFYWKGKVLTVPGAPNAFLQSAGNVAKTVGREAAEFGAGCIGGIGAFHGGTAKLRPIAQNFVYGRGAIAAGYAVSCVGFGTANAAGYDLSGPTLSY